MPDNLSDDYIDIVGQASEFVMLSDRTLSTNLEHILLETAEQPKLKFKLIQWVADSPTPKIRSQRKKEVADTLGISVRQVERLLEKYSQGELHENSGATRSDKGKHRIDPYWQDYIKNTWIKGNKDCQMSPINVYREVKRHAVIDLKLSDGEYPHQATVYRVLEPIIKQRNRKKTVRNPGSGSYLVVETRNGQFLKAEYSNQILQCDHTKLDVIVVDKDGDNLGRPWLTLVVDTYSSCINGFFLGMKQPSSEEVALALRHAILPKHYPPEYELTKNWEVYGPPLQYFFTDGGKDFRSKHLKLIGQKLGFTCELRARPSQGGIVERVFKTINTEVLQMLPGYTGSNVKERPENAENIACLTLKDLEKILVGFFCVTYNHGNYPKEKGVTRFDRWLRGMGGNLPTPIDESELDICLRKEDCRLVHTHGSVYFENLIYRGDALRPYVGQQVTLRYDPDNILNLRVYSYESDDRMGKFLGIVKPINLEYQDLTLDELKRINTKLNKGSKKIDNYSILIEQVRRNSLIEECKQTKKERARKEHKRARQSSNKNNNSNVIDLNQRKDLTITATTEQMELLPERLMKLQVEAITSEPNMDESPAQKVEVELQERHRLIINNRNKKPW
ncbi:transposase [Phormidium sp. LEGE 05292]|uniref:Mu transposase C-terminal domain-containing protein n=1 Tax=[Phormidium] sp. LEGE 05292 TaxID=767427 RepID=UPI001882D95D|nr:Mu transposase C-terminal domain-containing protein [Phormidium sp. LEGE 05292]MBE9224011.1 transposase [Phormidium sp. LEGE 05292]